MACHAACWLLAVDGWFVVCCLSLVVRCVLRVCCLLLCCVYCWLCVVCRLCCWLLVVGCCVLCVGV